MAKVVAFGSFNGSAVERATFAGSTPARGGVQPFLGG
jgi:hypothetical protein